MNRYIAIPMGECAGIGPEIIVKALSCDMRRQFGSILVVGDRALFTRLSRDLHIPLPFTSFVSDDKALERAMMNGESTIFYDIPCVDMEAFAYGVPSADTGMACYTTTWPESGTPATRP